MRSNFLLYFGLAILAVLAVGGGLGFWLAHATHSAHPVLYTIGGAVLVLVGVAGWYIVQIAKAAAVVT